MARKATRTPAGRRSASKSRTASKAARGRSAAKRPAPRKTSKATASKRRRTQSAEPKDLGDLFLETLKDIYHAEKQILRALPKMAKGAQSDELRQAFTKHTDETRVHAERLEKIFEMSGKRPQAKTCHAILGLVEEANEVLEEFNGSDALDAGLLAAAQAVEHYEISRYGTLKSWAEQHGMSEVAALLGQTLAEEKKTDELLTDIAESAVNQEASGIDREAA